ncbi:MAG: hypothetical protein CMJ90_10330 [Planctomycetes bacterium]|nr:hypothetical protein [Planctomycetota bacterium]
MGRIRQVRKEDGTLEPFREGKVVEAILRALVATGTSDRGLAEELAGVVVLFLDKYHGDTVPSLTDVEEMLCRVLRETGYGQAAERFTKFSQDRRRLEEEVVVRSLPGKEAGAIPGAPAEQVSPWSRDRLVQSLVRAGELPASFAEEVAAAVETRILQAGLLSVTPVLIREFVRCELMDRGLEAPSDDVVVGVTREEMAALVGGAVSEAPDRYIAGRALSGYALTGIHGEEVARAHLAGRIHVYGLSDPLKVERLVLPAGVLLPEDADERPVGDVLLAVRTQLDQVRSHVRASVVLPDLVGGLSRHRDAHADPERVVSLLLGALDFRDCYGMAGSPTPHLTVPLTGAAGASSRFLEVLLRRLSEHPEQGEWLPVSLALGAGPVPDGETLERTLNMASAREKTVLHILREEDCAPYPEERESPVPLTISLGRLAINLPLALLDAAGVGLQEALPELDAVAQIVRDAFHERFWYQRGGARWGLHGVVVGLGGGDKVQVNAQGQEVDLEIWGLAHALELLVRRGVVHPSRRPEAAARVLGYLDYLLGEEVAGVRFRVRLGGARDRGVRRLMLESLEGAASRYGIMDAQEMLRDESLDRSTLPVAVPLTSDRNRLLLEAPFAERTGPGLALPLAAFGAGDPGELLQRLRDETRLGLLTLSSRHAADDLFEVQEDLFS